MITSTNISAFGKPKIVTSIVPLAAIVTMLVHDHAIVSSIAITQSCPHHHHLKPSDLQKIKDADLVIYIDNKFDSFSTKIINNYNKNIIKISSFQSINFLTLDNKHNWHFWLNLSNVQACLEELATAIANSFPDLKNTIFSNLEIAKTRINELSQTKQQALANLTDVILLSDSAEHFFDNEYKIYTLYQNEYKSLKYINNLEQLLAKSVNRCIVLSSDQDSKLYHKLNATVVQIDSENWRLSLVNDKTFYDKYLQLIKQVAKCK